MRPSALSSIAAALFAACGFLCPPAGAAPHESSGVAFEACDGFEDLLFCGDLNGDCSVTAADALVGLRMSVGQIAPVAEADLDLSGVPSASDALRILRIAVGSLVQTYTCDPDHIVLLATHSGFYSHAGNHTPGNYAVGWFVLSSNELRDYFVFDLSSVDATITAATLRADTAPKGFGLYRSADPSETYQLVEVSTPVATLTGGSAGLAGFEDLTDGTVYGSIVLTAQNIQELTTVPLNDTALALLNAADGPVAFGGSITTLTKGPTNENIFNSTNATLRRELVLRIAPVE